MNYDLKTWHFSEKNDELVDLVLKGKKRATTSIYDGTLDELGIESILIYENEKQACITKTVKNIICEFKDVTCELAKLEGENKSLEDWQKNHRKYFQSIDCHFHENTKVVVEIFEVVKNLKQERLELGEKIAKNNLDIIGKIDFVEEIDAGFNNSIFSVNNQFIVKVCGDKQKENLFQIESNFYQENQNNENIPNLYKYDESKTIVPYCYEIIEYINGKSVYYFWYKWKEEEREEFIKKIMSILKKLHIKKNVKNDWCSKVKEEVLLYYQKCINLFSKEEQKIIESAINRFDDILVDNRYVSIHNDLHFDNIMIDILGNIKVIDFNDSIIAPLDYDFRLLFMCKDKPWKWANAEMDPYQKKEDYQNIISYLKKYYEELAEIKNLDQRMLIYFILNDMRQLPKYQSQELILSILENVKKINSTY